LYRSWKLYKHWYSLTAEE